MNTEAAAADVANKPTKPAANGSFKDVMEGKSDLFKVDPRIIKTKPGWNLRNSEDPKNIAHIDGLKSSIIEWGMQNPLSAYMEAGEVFLVDGHCRLAAVMKAINEGHEITTVPCLPVPRHFSEVDRLAMTRVKNSGKEPEPIEMADVCARMMNYGLDVAGVAKKLSYSVQQVNNLLTLRSAPKVVVDLVEAGTISATLATQIVKDAKGDDAAAVEDATKTVENAKAAGKDRATAKHREPKPEKAPKPAKGDDEFTAGPENSERKRAPRAAKPADGDLTRTPGYEAGLRRAIEIVKAELSHCDATPAIKALEDELNAE